MRAGVCNYVYMCVFMLDETDFSLAEMALVCDWKKYNHVTVWCCHLAINAAHIPLFRSIATAVDAVVNPLLLSHGHMR